MFLNLDRLDFGHTQNGTTVWDVNLPPYASSPYDFVSLMRKGL
jgi:hypothetical protein